MHFKLFTTVALAALFSALTQQSPIISSATSDLSPVFPRTTGLSPAKPTTDLSPAKATVTSDLSPAKPTTDLSPVFSPTIDRLSIGREKTVITSDLSPAKPTSDLSPAKPTTDLSPVLSPTTINRLSIGRRENAVVTSDLSPAKPTTDLSPAKAVVTPAPSAVAAFSSDLNNYLAKSLAQDSSFDALFGAVATNPAQQSIVEAAFQNTAAFAYNPSALSAAITAVPTQFQAFVSSVADVESSFALKDGVIGGSATAADSITASTTSVSTPTITNTSGADKVSKEMGFVAGAVMGVVGCVVM